MSLIAGKSPKRRRPIGRIVAASLLLLVASLSASAIGAGPVRAASCGTTNIALDQPTTASSIQGPSWPASNATDGNLTTRWSSAFSDPQWLEVDLGSTQSICQVVIHWEAAYANAFQIQTSNDNSTWTSIYSTTTGTGGTQTLNISGSGRYIRMYGTARATVYGYSIYEFQVYVGSGTGNTVTVTPPPNQASTVGTAASLQIQASDSAPGQTLTYSATGLPAGLSINASTGLISGTPTTAGSGSATATAKDTTGASGSATFSWTVNQQGSGTFPVTFQNNTRGTWSNAQIYVLVLGQAVPGQWSYLKPDGTLAHISHLDASAPGHLTKNGVNYPNMSFTLAQASTVSFPAQLQGARIYISVGSPMYIAVSPDDQGWAGPDLNNPADPNIDVYFDWYEFTYQFGVIPFGGNTTQVDMFGFPMTARLQQSTIGYDQTVGITLTRAQVMSQYTATVGTAFTSLAGTYRIVAPRSSPLFQPGGAQANYLQSYIDQTWAYYTTHQFTLTRLNQTFTGQVSGNTLTFTMDGTGPFVLNKPTTADVMACSGALASAGMSTTELALGAEFCAAFNRGVALNTAEWYDPAAYYTGAIKNDYAGFFHTISLNHLAYGFAYDDINDQSSVQILPNANPPTSLTIGVGW
jgi:Beta-1,3-glucanase/F5/8 type C domain/Putative Ig domain